jgi:LPS-assembly protein
MCLKAVMQALSKNLVANFALVMMAAFAAPSLAQNADPQEAGSLEADSVIFDKAQSALKADGNVNIEKAGQTLRADKVVWKQSEDVLRADGNVALTDINGTRTQAQSMVLNNQLSAGEIYKFRSVLPNQARFEAEQAEQSPEAVILQDAGYTACPECDAPDSYPLWRLRASQINYDKVKQDVVYKNIRLEVGGVPLFYSPYFNHPGPKVVRRSGFLTPRFASSTAFGAGFETPYYFDLAPNYDLTLTPRVSEKQDPYLASSWRHLVAAGHYEITNYLHKSDDVLLTSDPDQDLNFGVEAVGDFTFGQWNTKFAIKDANDDLFFRRYKIDSLDQMESNAVATRYSDHGYIQVSAYKYRSVLNNQTYKTVNQVLPSVTQRINFENLLAGGQMSLTNNFRHEQRALGLDISLAESSLDWTRQFGPSHGVIWELHNRLQVNAYHYDESAEDPIQSDNAPKTLAANSASLRASYPLQRLGDTTTQTLTPEAQLVLASDNERYQDVPYISTPKLDLTKSSLFQLSAPNSEASRVNLGVSHDLQHVNGLSTEFFIGQSYNISASDYTYASGYGDGASAYVLQGDVGYEGQDSRLSLTQNLRLDPSDNSTLRNQVSAQYSAKGISLGSTYSFFAAGQTATESKKEQSVRVDWEMSDSWTLQANHRRDLRNKRDVKSSADFVYEDICTILRVSLSRDYAEFDNIEPETSISITFVLKTLGGNP